MRAFLRVVLAGGVAALLLSACSSEQVARSFGNWCKRADNCTDNSRTQP
ncbi:hypothetical protein [Azospirillum rugosum]|uniref:Lipoprotein n=1 Tax=Azospirillum rugosum TaxID=416170 RepID=A0ABS4SNR3_9PROT|nr:hypothetical protein [Azospirillum rugosum]MBP2294201.1 hypothetical protein [Azospirillum rugosum]MDQ0527410.1 hypothetical protein [Azospirillum rugosum]